MHAINEIPKITYSARRKNEYRGTKTYYARFCEPGVPPVEFSLGTTDPEVADRWVRKQQTIYKLYCLDIADGVKPEREPLRRSNMQLKTKETLTITSASEAYLSHCANVRHLRQSSIDVYQRLFKSLLAYCEAHKLSKLHDITPAAAEEHIATSEWSAASQKLAINMFNNWFNHCRNIYGITAMNPWSVMSKPKIERAEKTVWTQQQMDDILAHAPDQQTLVYWAILRYCGPRNTETAELNWSDWNMEDNTITIKAEDAKSRKSRKLYVTPVLNVYLQNWYNAHTEHEGKMFSLSKDVGHRNRTMHGVLEKLGLQGSLHSFRHSFITHALEQKQDAYTVSKLAGHSDPSTTLKWYCHISDSKLQEAAEQIVA